MKTTQPIAMSRFARLRASVPALLIATACALGSGAQAGQPKDSALLSALRQGGCVILMRHASSPDALPTARRAAPGNARRERQLDGEGLARARAMGAALRRLGIPIGEVMSSPTFRARETIAAAGLGPPRVVAQLGDGGHSMSQSAVAAWSAWLRHAVAQPPPAGSNTLIVTQAPNISDAYGQVASGLEAGGALIFRPDGHGNSPLLAPMQIGDWPRLAAQFGR